MPRKKPKGVQGNRKQLHQAPYDTIILWGQTTSSGGFPSLEECLATVLTSTH